MTERKRSNTTPELGQTESQKIKKTKTNRVIKGSSEVKIKGVKQVCKQTYNNK